MGKSEIREEKVLQKSETCGKMDTNQKRYLCPHCGKHTVLWLLPSTRVKDLPVKCKRCGMESVVNIELEPEP